MAYEMSGKHGLGKEMFPSSLGGGSQFGELISVLLEEQGTSTMETVLTTMGMV